MGQGRRRPPTGWPSLRGLCGSGARPEDVVKRTRAQGSTVGEDGRRGGLQRQTCRCRQNRPRAPGPSTVRSRQTSRWDGWRKTVHFSQGRIERALQLLEILDHAEAAFGVGVGEGVGNDDRLWLIEDACRGVGSSSASAASAGRWLLEGRGRDPR